MGLRKENMYREGKLRIKYTFDENDNITSAFVIPNNRNSTVVEITNALTAALVIQLSNSLHLQQGDVAKAIVESIKALIPDREETKS